MPQKVLMIIGDFAEDLEVYFAYQALQMVGIDVDIVSPGKKNKDTIQLAVHDFEDKQTFIERWGHKIPLNYNLDDVNP